MARKCLVGYTRASSCFGHSYGERFDRLEECCDKFKSFFFNTGNYKYASFNSRSPEEKVGINLVTRGGVVSLVLLLTEPLTEYCPKFCPFCGAEIELACTKRVELKLKTKEVPDGYKEIVRWQREEEKVEQAI